MIFFSDWKKLIFCSSDFKTGFDNLPVVVTLIGDADLFTFSMSAVQYTELNCAPGGGGGALQLRLYVGVTHSQTKCGPSTNKNRPIPRLRTINMNQN